MRQVYIDGVKYVPCTQVLVNHEKLVKALLGQFWGYGYISDENYKDSMDLRIIVSDSLPETTGESIQELVDRLSEVE